MSQKYAFRSCLFALLLALSSHTQLSAASSYTDNCYVDCCGSSDTNSRFFVYADFLYWQATQDQMQYAAELPGGIQNIIADVIAAPPLLIDENLSLIDPCFEYKPGFRVGLGFVPACSNWDLELEWTSLHEKISSHVFNEDSGIFPLTMPTGIIFTFLGGDPTAFAFADTATSHWDFKYDTIDLAIGRECLLASCLLFRPLSEQKQL